MRHLIRLFVTGLFLLILPVAHVGAELIVPAVPSLSPNGLLSSEPPKQKVRQADLAKKLEGLLSVCDIETDDSMVRGSYVLDKSSPLAPHLKAGVGLVTFSSQNGKILPYEEDHLDESAVAYQLGAGLGLDLGPASRLEVGYLFQTAGSQLMRASVDRESFESSDHHFTFGVKIGF